MSTVTVESVTKVFPGGVRAIDGLDLEVADGEFFALLGPSGCGKTTLLRAIAGLEAPSAGRIRIGGADVTRLPPGARNVAMVFQDYALFPHMNVTGNIAYPLRVKRVPRHDRHERAAGIAASLSLGELLDRRPGQLSGGQQQRTALARAVAASPQVFLLDEPLSNLDARLRLEARSFLKQLQRELGITTIFVTHDQAEALALADRIAVMDAGHIRQLGTPREIFHRPVSVFVAGFIGSTPMNLLDGTLRSDGTEQRSAGTDTTETASTVVDVAGAAVPLPGRGVPEAIADGKVTVGIRPEHMVPTDASAAAFAVTVTVVENLGTSVLVTSETADGTAVKAVLPEEAEPPPGAALHLRPLRVLLFDAGTGDLIGSSEPG